MSSRPNRVPPHPGRGTLWYHRVPYGTIGYHMVPYGTIIVPYGTIMVPYGTIWYHYGTVMVPYGTIWYHYGTIWYHTLPYGLPVFPFVQDVPFSHFSIFLFFCMFPKCPKRLTIVSKLFPCFCPGFVIFSRFFQVAYLRTMVKHG